GMDATQMISDSILESDEEDNEEEIENKRGRPLAKLCILKNKHIPEAEFPLFLGDNVLGRDPNSCTVPLPASSVSKQHATICLCVYRRRACRSEVDMEALVWDLGSMNGTRKGRLKLTPNVRYALSEGDSLVVADIPCQFVICGVDSSQGDASSPLRQNSGVKTKLPDASGEKGDDTSTDSKKCVNGGTETPVRASCLTFEQTPHQPQGTLVPESDSDSDNLLICFSLFYSDNESPMTVSSSSKNKPNRHDSFTTQETDVDAARQQLEEKKVVALVEDSEEEEERAVQAGTKSLKGGWHMPVEKESNASFTGDGELSTPAVSTDAIPAFNMDSDTDVEGEDEEVASAGPVTLNTNQQVDQPPKTAQFHMDSDTDIDEDDDASGKAPKALPSSDENAKTPHAVSVIPPEGVTMDSDTDVDDDGVVSDAATKAGPTVCQSAHTADSAFSVQAEDFHLHSDTDVDEDEAKNTTDETPNKSDIKLTALKSAPVAPDNLQVESDTDDEALPVPATSKPSVVAAVADSRPTAVADADLEILSDSDTDVEDASLLAIPVGVTTLSASPGPTLKASLADSDADTDVDESSVPPVGDEAKPADVRVDGDTEDKKSDIGEEGEDQVPRLHRETTPGLLAPLLQNCSTPVQMSGNRSIFRIHLDCKYLLVCFICIVGAQNKDGALSGLEILSFFFFWPTGAAVPAVRPVVLSSCSDIQEEEDFAVAETQSFTFQSRDRVSSEEPTQAFVLESSCDNKNDQSTKEESFQLGLSDSSHLQCPDQALAMENTQAFVSVERGVNLEDTQAYAAMSAADRSSAENDANLEATQDYVEDKETERYQVDVALEATQVYVAEPYSHAEDDADDDACETQPSDFTASSTLAIAETQPMLPIAGEEDLAAENPVCSVQQIQPRSLKEDGPKAAQPQEKGLSDAQSVTETQPVCTSDSEASDDEGSFPAQRNRTAKPLPLEEAQTQDLTCSELSVSETQPMHGGIAETQPMATCDDDDEDSMPGPRKRKAKQLHLEEEETQPVADSELSTQLQPEEEMQTLASSEVSALETQPLSTNEGQQSDEEDVIACTRKRKAKPLQLEEEQTQPLTSADVETPAVVTGKCDDKDSIPGPRKRKAKQMKLEEKTQPVDNSKMTHVETRPLTTKTGLSPSEESEAGTSGACVPNLRVTRAKPREEEDQVACPGPSKRQTRGRSGKPLSDGDNNKEMVKRARGRKITKQQKHDGEEEDETPVRERNKQAVNKSLIKQQDGKDREEEDGADLRQEREENDNERRTTDERKKHQDEIEMQLMEEKLETEGRVNKEQERLQAEDAARAEREIKEKEEQQKIESERIEREERERLEREEKERLERERKEQEKETAKREQEERLEREQQLQARLEREEREMEERERVEKEKEAQEKQLKELEEKKEEQDKSKTPSRGRRTTRRTIASQSTAEPDQDSTVSTNDDFPARRTRSRSNSSNSVSSERSASSVHAQESKGRGRGRGRGTRETSETPQKPVARSSNRRTTVAAGAVEHEPDSSNSLAPEVSSCSVSSHNRGRGGRQRGRARKTEHDPDSIPSVSQSQSDQNLSPARGRKGKKAEESSNEALHKNGKEDSQPATTTRGRQQPSAATDEEDQSKLLLSQVLFTGVMDEAGEKVLARLGGSLAKGVGDMNCLVTDKVRRTVKFLCALAKGIPIVTTDWLEKSGKAGSFLSPSSFIVKDPEQEKKFNFSLHESLRIASSQPLLKGYEVHVTRSVKPEPVHMKDIISSSGATFLPKMPSSNKPHTVVVSCEEDWSLCRPALSASLPVVTAEFILTGILQQKLDFQSHTLSPSTANVQPAGGRGRGRRKT
uniref:Mediator of DNA damage checkpoint protein 1 n=1 Tax=Maylandia zebra TaxID=106582 RepID=A0A3P9CQ20_9CICH